MSKPYDVVTKHLTAADPMAWAKWLGIRAKKVSPYNVDLSTVSLAADALLLAEDIKRELIHLEFQASYKKNTSVRLLQYNVLGNRKLNIPVRSMLILLRPEAAG